MKPTIHPDDFPVEANETTVTTNNGKPLADAESTPVAKEIAERLNEQAYREEHERWSP
ncbi:hypothetical protein [Bradyrhizobium sp. DOA1]|uniref:hypothetical protein n=1 Tax=Bradyrhizobium sp. DOA1 TaxID=1126616 RepID=UPI000B025C47|nr:hypothetical protein [Bradyrhizobium sp. DOA1]